MRVNLWFVLSAALLAPSLLQVCIGRDLYSVLGLRRQSTEDDIKKAYRSLAKKFHPDKNPSEEAKYKFLEIQRAYETLGDKDKRREYDRTGRDANQQQQPNQGGGFQRNHHFHNHFHEHFFHQHFQEHIKSDTHKLSSADFGRRVFNSHTPWLVQLYHDRHPDCAVFSRVWEAAAKELGGWVHLGRVEVTRERAVLAQMRLQGQLRVPSVYGFPPRCSSMQCSVRLPGSFHSWRDQTISDFVANKLLKLDSIPDVGPSGVRKFLSRVPPHKVGVLAFSARGKSASLALRKAATDAASGTAFGRVPRPSSPKDVAFWRKEFGVTTWPSVVFFKGPGSEPLVIDSNSDRIDVAKLVKEHGRQALPALRHNTVKALGCTFGGKQQLGGKGYCAVLVGRHSELMERSRAALVEVLAILDDREAPLEYADAARLYLKRVVSLTWIDAAQQPSWCRYHLGSSAPACSRWPWQSSEVSLVVFVSGGGHAHRWVTYDGDIGRDLQDKGPEEFASWLSQLLSSQGAMFKERTTPPDPLVDMDKPGLVVEAATVAASAINDLINTAFASEEVVQVMFNAWPLLLFAALALFNMTGFLSDDSGPQPAGQARGPMRFVDPDEDEDGGNQGAGGDTEPLTDEQISRRALSATPSLTKVATMPPRRDSPRYLLLLVLPDTIDHNDPDMSAGILNSMRLAKRFEPDRKFAFFKLWVSDQPEWSDLVQKTLKRSPDGKDRCCLMIWAPCRKRCQVVWPLNLDRAMNRMEDIVSGGGSWDRVSVPSLW